MSYGCYGRKWKDFFVALLVVVSLVMIAIRKYSSLHLWVIKLAVSIVNVLCFVFQADLQSTLGDAGYIVFGVILFVWELLPTSLVVFFFRVRQPDLDRVSQESSQGLQDESEGSQDD